MRFMRFARDPFVLTVLMLLSVGMMMVFSASITSRPSANEQV
jgi:hypothetical protein